MEQFAKLLEIAGRQVVVLRLSDHDDETDPYKVRAIFLIGDSDTLNETTWSFETLEQRDKLFNEIESKIEAIERHILKLEEWFNEAISES